MPFGAVGIYDSVNMLLDSNDIVKIPFLGKNALESSKRIPQTRPGGGDRFIAPVSVPGLPSRNYFIFEEVCLYSIVQYSLLMYVMFTV